MSRFTILVLCLATNIFRNSLTKRVLLISILTKVAARISIDTTWSTRTSSVLGIIDLEVDILHFGGLIGYWVVLASVRTARSWILA